MIKKNKQVLDARNGMSQHNVYVHIILCAVHTYIYIYIGTDTFMCFQRQ